MSDAQARKLGSLTFTTDGDKIDAFFTDQNGNNERILFGRSMDDCYKAISTAVLLMQRRNGFLNFLPDGTVNPDATETLKPALDEIVANDKGTGWSKAIPLLPIQ